MYIEDEYQEYIKHHFLESKTSALKIFHEIQNSELNAGGHDYTHTLHIPKIFTAEDQDIFRSIVDRTYTIFTKVINAYHKDENVRSLFPFSKELEEYIVLKPRYCIPIPICRIDIFYDEETKDFHFCEFNTDGTSAMNENRHLDQLLQLNNVYVKDEHQYEHMELVESWVEAFLKLAEQDPKVPEHPMIAIVDFLENSYINELYVFQSEFKKRGCQCEVLDIHDMAFDGEHLYSIYTDRKIDMVYRRVVTGDIAERVGGVDFLEAVKADAVSLVGAFQTQIIHHKEISKVLVNPIMKQYFTDKENEFLEQHLPATYDLTKDLSIDISKKEDWIIKPKDSYGAQGVWAGIDLDEKQWQRVVEKCMDTDYIIQKYIRPYQTKNIDLVNHDEFIDYTNMTGLYVYNGKFAGVYSRCSDAGIISTQYNEKSIATLFLKDESAMKQDLK